MPLHGEIVVIKRNGTDGAHFPLTATSCLFGRNAGCDIRIQLPHVSKEHCKVEVQDNGEVFVTNLGSVNPTQLNGTIVKRAIRLNHGDVITIIDRSFRFEKPPAQKGKRRSTGLDSETFKVFASHQPSDTNETVRIETLLSSKTQRKSEGNITKTTHSRRSLQISSSSEPRNNLSPFGELYEMLKSEVGSQNGKTPVKDKSSSPKNVVLRRSLQIEDGSKSPAVSKRNSRSQSSDSPVTRPKELVVEARSASAGRVREASKSPLRSPKTSSKNESFQGKAAQEPEQTTRSSSKRDSQSLPQGQVAPSVNGNVQKRSPRRSAASAELAQVLTRVHAAPNNSKPPDTSTPQRRSGQTVPEQPEVKKEDKSPTQGRRSASLDKSPKASKPPATEVKTSEVELRKSPRKRRSDELSLPDPPPKRKRVSFGGHLSPELFDKRLPPNSPLKKGATPARRSLSLHSPRIVMRKSFGPKQAVIREVFESASVTPTPARASRSSPAKSSSVRGSPAVTENEKLQATKSPTKPSASEKTPTKSPARRSVGEKSPVVSLIPSNKSPVKTTSTTSTKLIPLKKSPSAKSPVKSSSISPKKTPIRHLSSIPVKTPTPAKRSPVAKTPSPVAKTATSAKRSPVAKTATSAKTPSPAKRSPVAKTPSPAKRSPVAKTPSPVAKTPSPAKRSPVAKTPSPAKRSPVAKTPSPAKRSPVAKTPSPAKRSPVAKTPSPAKKSPVAKTLSPAKRSPVAKMPSPAKKTPAKRSPVAKTPSPAKRSKLAKTPSPAKKTPAKRSPVAKTPTPAKWSPVAKTPSPAKKTPAKRSPVAKTPSPAKRSKLAKTPSSAKKTPAKRSPVAKTPTPAKRSPVAKTPTPAKRSPVAKTPSPAKRSKLAKTPSPAKKTPAKRSPVAKTPTSAKRSPVAKTPTSAKRSPVAKTPTPAKRSPVAKTPSPAKRSKLAKTPSPAKRFPVAKTPTSAKRFPVAKTPTSAKRSPVAKTPTPAKKTPAKRSPVVKTPTPAKRSPVAKTPSPAKRFPVAKMPTPAKRSPVAKTPSPAKKTLAKRSPVAKTPTPAKRSPVAKTPTPAKRSPAAKMPTPATPYMRGRFSVSRIDTPPQEQFPSDLPTSQTPKTSRKSLSIKKTPRRSRKLEAFQLIRSRRRSGATEANLLVSRTWADVVKIGVAKAQKKIDKTVQKVAATKKKLKHKTPMKKLKDLTSTGHADSPATILVGRAHTRVGNLTGYVPKVVRNQAVKLDTAHNESFTGMTELFSTPANNKQRKSNRLESSKTDSPSSVVVEMSVMQTPEESGEMVVSPLNSPNTTRRKQYSRDAVSRLLQSPASPKSTEQTSESQKNKRKSVGLSGVKRIMRTPKQKGTPVTDPHALRKLLRTPKESESPQAYSRRSTNLGVLGTDRLVKTPKQKAASVENFTGVHRIMKTSKQKGEPAEDLAGVKRIMRTPKEKVQPVEDMIGIKRLMRTPKEKSQPVEDMIGIKRLMRTPKERGQPVEDMALNHLMGTPMESVQSTETTRPIEEIFGIRNLIKTPPKSKPEEVLSTDANSQSAKSSGNASGHRGRPAKRLSLPVDKKTGSVAHNTLQAQIVQESVTRSSQEVVQSTQKRGRSSKSQSITSLEFPKEHVVPEEVTSPKCRGRPSSATKAPKESLSASEAKVTSPQRGRPKAVVEESTESVPVADGKMASPTRKGKPSTTAAPKEPVSDAVSKVTSPRPRGRPSPKAKESLAASDAKVTSEAMVAEPQNSLPVGKMTSPARKGRSSSTAETPKEPVSDAVSEVTSPRRRGRPSSTAEAPKESLPASDAKVTAPTQRGRPKAVVEEPKKSVPVAADKITSPARKGRPSITAEAHKEAVSDAVSEVTSPRRRGRPNSTAEASKKSPAASGKTSLPTSQVAVPEESVPVADSGSEVVSPRRRGRPSSTGKAPKESLAEVTSPTRGKSKAVPEKLKDSVPAADNTVTSPARKGRHSTAAEAPKEPGVSEVTSPTRRGRPRTSAISDESVQLTSSVPKGSSSTTTKVLKESLPVSGVKSPVRRGRPQKSTAPALETPAIAKSKLSSPTRKEKLSTPTEISKKSVPDSVNVVTSPTRSGVAKDPVPVAEGKITSQTRRGRQKTKADLTHEPSAAEVLPTRGSRSRGAAAMTEVFITVGDELPDTQTLGGRPKASAQAAKVSSSDPEVDVTSPTRGSRSKDIAEPSKDSLTVLIEVGVTQKRRGRAKATDVTSEAPAPTRGSRSKAIADLAVESGPAEEEATKRRGRPRKADVPKESVAVPEVTLSVEEANPKSTEDRVSNKVTSPTRKGSSRNTDVPKETAPVITAPRRRGKAETTEERLTSPEKPSEDSDEKTTKSTKKTVRQNVKKSSKHSAGELQAPEPEESLAPVSEKKTQLPPSRGRRKATQNEPVPSEVSGDPSPSLKEEQPERITIHTSPVARRGGRRRNAEEPSIIEPDVAKPKTSKPETKSKSRSKSKGVTEVVTENTDSTASEEPVKSPEPKSPKKSARQTKNVVTEPPVESQPKSLRGRPSKRKENSLEASSKTVVPETEVSQKAAPRGRPRTARDITNVSAADEQTKGSSTKQQRSSRRNPSSHEDSSASHEEQAEPVSSEETVSSTRRTRGKKTPDSDESQSAPEVKGRKNARGKTVQIVDKETITKSNTKSVQWHPLLATDIHRTEMSSEESNEVPTRGGRSRAKTIPAASEVKVPAKRSRRGNDQAEAEEIPASTNPEPLTVSDVVEVAPRKRGRKANVQEKGDTHAKSTHASTEAIHTSPQRGRRGASKAVDGENTEVRNVESSRRPRGAAASKTPAENERTQSPVTSKSPKGKAKAEESSSKSTRGVKRKLPNTEAKTAPLEPETPSQASESILMDTENIPAGRVRKNQRNTKTQKSEVKEALPEKTSESPAKRRKTEAVPTAVQKRSSRQQAPKVENEKPSAATKTRTSTRSRK